MPVYLLSGAEFYVLRMRTSPSTSAFIKPRRACAARVTVPRPAIAVTSNHLRSITSTSHSNVRVSPSFIIRQLADGDPDVFRVAKYILCMS